MAGTSHIDKNRRSWDQSSDEYQRLHGDQLGRNPTAWGVWALPEQELNILGDIAGKRILEFGCGAAQWAIALAANGAEFVVGMDLSGQQLVHARDAARSSESSVALVQASGERTPFADASFDIVFCDHGAMTYADPAHTVAEAARLLRPAGRFAFNINSPFHTTCWDEKEDRLTRRLVNNYFTRRVIRDELNDSFTLPYGEWIRLFRRNGLLVEDLVEPRPAPDAKTSYRHYAPRTWARKWPAESIWILSKPGH